MKRYMVMTIYSIHEQMQEDDDAPILEESYWSIKCHGFFEQPSDALKCFRDNSADVIINCEDGTLVEGDKKRAEGSECLTML